MQARSHLRGLEARGKRQRGLGTGGSHTPPLLTLAGLLHKICKEAGKSSLQGAERRGHSGKHQGHQLARLQRGKSMGPRRPRGGRTASLSSRAECPGLCGVMLKVRDTPSR